MRCYRALWLLTNSSSSLKTMTKRDAGHQATIASFPRPAKTKRRSVTHELGSPTEFQRSSLVAAVERCTSSKQALTVAQEISLTDDGASWVYYVPKWYRHMYENWEGNGDKLAYCHWFDGVWALHPTECGTIKLFGKEIKTPRYQQAYGVTHRFSGATFPAKPFPDLLQHAVSIIQSMLVDPSTRETRLAAGLLNWYADGEHYMGPHSDEGVNIQDGSPIFSLTLGPAVRRFVFAPRGRDTSGKRKIELELGDGDLLIMGGTTQKTHKHALPRMKRCGDRRVNVTLRCFK